LDQRLHARTGLTPESDLQTWKIDTTHSTVGFVVRFMLVSKVRGRFNRWRGELQFDEAVPLSGAVTAHIEAASIDTNDRQRDAHLRSADFLDAARSPELSFRSSRVEPAGDKRFLLVGHLTIRGVTREVSLDVEYGGRMSDPMGNQRIGFMARTTINRRTFGITFNQVLDSGGLALGNTLEVDIEIQAVSE
jgi:polyisoprenoid-binding protein YceI